MNIETPNPDMILAQIDNLRDAAQHTPLFVDNEAQIEHPIFKEYEKLVEAAIRSKPVMRRAREIQHAISNIPFAVAS